MRYPCIIHADIFSESILIMLFDDPALRQLKNTFEKEKVRKEGYIKSTDRAFGFLEVDRDSYFIAPNDMKNVVNGDKVVAIIEKEGDKNKAIPEKLVEPYLTRDRKSVV